MQTLRAEYPSAVIGNPFEELGEDALSRNKQGLYLHSYMDTIPCLCVC